MKNYYEILEVSKNASKEVIEKAYKVLAKKYHPDLQKEADKKQSEQKMKLINEAYEVLSHDIRKKQYDIELEKEFKLQMQEKLNKVNSQRVNNEQNSKYTYEKEQKNKNHNNYYYENEQQLTKQEIKSRIKEENKAKKEYQKERERIYRSYLRSLGYRVKERWTFRKTIRLFKIFGIIIIICIILWFFPPTHKMIMETYEKNNIIRIIIDIIIKIIIGIAQAIGNFFKIIFSKK